MNALIFATLVTLSVAVPVQHNSGHLGYTVVLQGGQEYGSEVGGPHSEAAQLTGPTSGPVNIVGPSVGAISIVGPSFNAEALAAVEGPAEVPFKKSHGYGW